MNIKNIFLRFNSILLQIAAFSLGFRSTIGMSLFENYILLRLVTFMTWAIVFLACFLDSYTIKDILKIVMLFTIGFFILKYSKVNSVVFNFLFLCAVKNQNIEKIFKSNFWGVLLAFIFIVFSSQIGIIESRVLDGGNAIVFINPNCVSSFFTILILNYVARKYYKLRFLNIFIIAVASVFVYVICKSRSGLVLNFLLVIGLFLFKTVKYSKFIFKKWIFIFVLLLCFFGLWVFSSAILSLCLQK